jgi:hypothetical protein
LALTTQTTTLIAIVQQEQVKMESYWYVKYGPSRSKARGPLGYGLLYARGWALVHPVMLLARQAKPSEARTSAIAAVVPSGFEYLFTGLRV